MFELLKTLVENLISIYQKIKCRFSCCNTEVNVRVVEVFKTPNNSFYDKYQ